MSDLSLLHELRETAVLAARRAGAVIAANYTKPREVREKRGPRDLVTDTDHAAQAVVLETISERHPDHFILAEENPLERPNSQGVWPIRDGVVWTVDPLDGTTNFTTGIPMFCTAVGAAIDGEPVAGAIYDPMRDEMIVAARGLGATLNGKPLPPLGQVRLRHSTVSLDWSRGKLTRQQVVRFVDDLAHACRTLRALGSAALALGYVGLGRVQVYLNFGLQPWDTGAAAAIIREVGGELWRIDGTPWVFGEPGLIAGHPSVLEEVVRVAEHAGQ